MHALLLDFYDTRRQYAWLNWLLLGIAVLAAASLAWRLVSINTEIDGLDAQRSFMETKLQRGKHPTHLSATDALQLRAEVKDANAVLTDLSLPWDSLFEDIGAAQDAEVALLSIVPDAARRTIKISGEAKNLDAIVDYIRGLQKAKSLRAVFLQNHQVDLRSAQKPVHFTLLATWMVAP